MDIIKKEEFRFDLDCEPYQIDAWFVEKENIETTKLTIKRHLDRESIVSFNTLKGEQEK